MNAGSKAGREPSAEFLGANRWRRSRVLSDAFSVYNIIVVHLLRLYSMFGRRASGSVLGFKNQISRDFLPLFLTNLILA